MIKFPSYRIKNAESWVLLLSSSIYIPGCGDTGCRTSTLYIYFFLVYILYGVVWTWGFEPKRSWKHISHKIVEKLYCHKKIAQYRRTLCSSINSIHTGHFPFWILKHKKKPNKTNYLRQKFRISFGWKWNCFLECSMWTIFNFTISGIAPLYEQRGKKERAVNSDTK